MKPQVYYKKGFKYVLNRDFYTTIPLFPALTVEYRNHPEDDPFIVLKSSGELFIRRYYAWDGASGPTIDTPSSIRASLVHDALYQLVRNGLLSPDLRGKIDEIFREICKDAGMNRLRAALWYSGVRIGGGPSANPKNERVELTAP